MDRCFAVDVIEKNRIKTILIIERKIVKNENQRTAQGVKVNFLLQQDEDGYPPFSVESIWTIKNGNNSYIVDSIPFYVCNLSIEDEIAVKKKQGELFFDKIIKESQNSTMRIYCKNEVAINRLKATLLNLGCKWEFSNIKSLSAVNVPSTSYIEVENIITLMKNEDEALGFEISCKRLKENK
ncbi:hypothetical protein FACS1894181_15610 [Bacteroidia bacterium]|nr:hypothetical protein FACS1894181_15610 [Bacteroidia bacterium]